MKDNKHSISIHYQRDITDNDEIKTRVIIRLHDEHAGTKIVDVELTAEEFTSALSSLSNRPCKIDLGDVKKFNKVMEHKTFEFKIGDGWNLNDEELAKEKLKEVIPEGWEGGNFSSKDSFFNKENERYARTIIRRWV